MAGHTGCGGGRGRWGAGQGRAWGQGRTRWARGRGRTRARGAGRWGAAGRGGAVVTRGVGRAGATRGAGAWGARQDTWGRGARQDTRGAGAGALGARSHAGRAAGQPRGAGRGGAGRGQARGRGARQDTRGAGHGAGARGRGRTRGARGRGARGRGGAVQDTRGAGPPAPLLLAAGRAGAASPRPGCGTACSRAPRPQPDSALDIWRGKAQSAAHDGPGAQPPGEKARGERLRQAACSAWLRAGGLGCLHPSQTQAHMFVQKLRLQKHPLLWERRCYCELTAPQTPGRRLLSQAVLQFPIRLQWKV